MTTFGERLRTLRRAAGLSQTQLAGDGLSPSYISLLESDRRRPSPGVAAQLAAKLGCSTSQLLDGEPSERERRVQLELAYAELALRHEGAADAVVRLTALLEEPELLPGDRAEAALLLARAHERVGDLPAAVATLTPLFEQARAGHGPFAVTRVATHLCYCYVAAGDLHRAVTVGEQALEACRAQGLDRTDDYFMLAATVMSSYGDLGDELHAAVLARQLIHEAEEVGSLRGQASLYWNAAVLAEREGRVDEALHLSRRALAHLGELGESRDLARLKLASAEVLLAADPPQGGRGPRDPRSGRRGAAATWWGDRRRHLGAPAVDDRPPGRRRGACRGACPVGDRACSRGGRVRAAEPRPSGARGCSRGAGPARRSHEPLPDLRRSALHGQRRASKCPRMA